MEALVYGSTYTEDSDDDDVDTEENANAYVNDADAVDNAENVDAADAVANDKNVDAADAADNDETADAADTVDKAETADADALLLHKKSMQHRDAVRAAMSHKREQAVGLASMESERQAATEDALKVLYFILRHNLPLDLFPDLVELSMDLGTSRLRSLHAWKDATHASRKPAQETETCAHLLPMPVSQSCSRVQ